MPCFTIRAPDHLGDGVMALPAIQSLQAAGQARVVGPAWAADLYGSSSVDAGPAEVAVLFKPSWSAAWRARRHPRRVGLATDGRWPLLTDAIVPSGRHRVDDFNAVATVAGAQPAGLPSFRPEPVEVPGLPEHFVLLLPLTKSPETVAWTRFTALADSIGQGLAVFAAGPGEDQALASLAGPHRTLPALSIAAFAAVAARAEAVVGNDSGLTHLAAAAIRGAGGDPSRVHVVFGSTDPSRTGPPGATTHRVEPPACWPCYAKRCSHEVRPAPCLSTTVADVAAALSEAM